MKSLLEMALEMTASYIYEKGLDLESVVGILKQFHVVLCELRQVELGKEGGGVEKFADPHDSIMKNEIECLECGKRFRLLSNRHLALHGLTPRTYKQKHGIRMTQGLSAETLTARRKKQAKELGMGKQLEKWRNDQREERRIHFPAAFSQ